jgi:hypothetical protein
MKLAVLFVALMLLANTAIAEEPTLKVIQLDAQCGEKHTLQVLTENGYSIGHIDYFEDPVCDESLVISADKPGELFRKLREYNEARNAETY